jgi:hypothetical protein
VGSAVTDPLVTCVVTVKWSTYADFTVTGYDMDGQFETLSKDSFFYITSILLPKVYRNGVAEAQI